MYVVNSSQLYRNKDGQTKLSVSLCFPATRVEPPTRLPHGQLISIRRLGDWRAAHIHKLLLSFYTLSHTQNHCDWADIYVSTGYTDLLGRLLSFFLLQPHLHTKAWWLECVYVLIVHAACFVCVTRTALQGAAKPVGVMQGYDIWVGIWVTSVGNCDFITEAPYLGMKG